MWHYRDSDSGGSIETSEEAPARRSAHAQRSVLLKDDLGESDSGGEALPTSPGSGRFEYIDNGQVRVFKERSQGIVQNVRLRFVRTSQEFRLIAAPRIAVESLWDPNQENSPILIIVDEQGFFVEIHSESMESSLDSIQKVMLTRLCQQGDIPGAKAPKVKAET